MKVMLTAFGGKLKGLMEIPDNFNERDIYLMMDMEQPSYEREPRGQKVYELTTVRGRFEATNGHFSLSEGGFAEEYKLVEVQK